VQHAKRYADGKLKDSGLDHWTAEANRSWDATTRQSTKPARNQTPLGKAHHAIAYTCTANRYGVYGNAARIILGAEEVFGKPFVEEMRSLFLLLFRDVLGNPFRPVTLDASWRTPGVRGLAQEIYEERTMPEGTLDPTRLSILADALEDAGCDNEDLLAHCRRQGAVHVRGCWVVDRLLGME
jgi:hypothetical protein